MRPLLRATLIGLVGLHAAPAYGQSLQDILFGRVQRQAQGALAVFGISAIPSETASTLQLEIDTATENQYEFVASQLGGGFTISESFPLYLEGFIGYNRYDPTLVLTRGAEASRLPLKWTSVAATGGIGWDFRITDDLVLRPMVHIAAGRVQTDLSVAGTFVANRLGLDVSFLESGGIWVGGLGGSLGLQYNHRWESDYEFDATLRYTHIRLEPIAGDNELSASADAATAALWTRLRVPTGLDLFQRPVRWVFEASGSYLPGDQGKALESEWLGQVGSGIEIDLEKTFVPLVTTTRLVARYTFGENLTGFSIGLAASF
jgi:hypothetical protein